MAEGYGPFGAMPAALAIYNAWHNNEVVAVVFNEGDGTFNEGDGLCARLVVEKLLQLFSMKVEEPPL